MKLFLRLALISLIPGFFFSSIALNLLVFACDQADISLLEDDKKLYSSIFFFLGTVSIFIFNYLFLTTKEKKKKLVQRNDILVKMNINDLLLDLSDQLGHKGNIFNIRVFKTKTPSYLKKFFDDSTYLENANIRDLTDKIISSATLSFKYNKTKNIIEGVVGMCYHVGKFYADFNPSTTNNAYILTDEQQNQVDNVKFCSASPIIRNGNIPYVISLDSTININKDENAKNKLLVTMRTIGRIFDFYILK